MCVCVCVCVCVFAWAVLGQLGAGLPYFATNSEVDNPDRQFPVRGLRASSIHSVQITDATERHLLLCP